MARKPLRRDHRPMDKPPMLRVPRGPWRERLSRWADRLGARDGQRVLVALAIGMALVLLMSYVEVLQDQVARASSVEHVARAGAARPADAGAAGTGTEGARAEPTHMR